jgi:hypothetical protein
MRGVANRAVQTSREIGFAKLRFLWTQILIVLGENKD